MLLVRQLWEDGLSGKMLNLVIPKAGSFLILVQLIKSEGILNITIAVSPKPSFLLNERIYTKLIVEHDQLWAINALEATAMRALVEMGNAWSIAAIYFVVNPKLSRNVRSAAKHMLQNVLINISSERRVKVAEIVILGIEEWLRQVTNVRCTC
jgi:Generalcontrol nonderepressible 1 (Gcn1) N-terminal